MGIIVRKGNNEDFFRTFREMQRDGDFYNGMSVMPKVDVFADDKAYTFEFELPGFRKEDVKANVEDNILTVSGVIKKAIKEGDGKHYHVSERKYGSFKRQFSLPEDSDLNGISARYNEGVLELKIDRKIEEKKQSINVEIN